MISSKIGHGSGTECGGKSHLFKLLHMREYHLVKERLLLLSLEKGGLGIMQ